MIEETFHEVAEAFVSALKGCMVDPCRDSILRKLSFVLGATSCTLLNKDAVGLGPDAAQHQLFEQLLSFCVRGMSESNTVSN